MQCMASGENGQSETVNGLMVREIVGRNQN
jgi:hypothetical protein